ncbi:MAG: sulfopyruvate decarboxylase subunit beta [Deltaproteobacteria bacterium]|nr:sulfopyruvate decarboxylase subunit beta [Deltaproteobacteria bacterium]
MIHAEQHVIQIMEQAGINFVATLPCDRTKNLLPLIGKSFEEIELTREEDGLGICAGAWLSNARPMMIIQSSGLGNMLGALASLNVASAIPIPVLASWRGVYKEGIDSQIPFGKHLPAILEGAGIHYSIIDKTETLFLLSEAIQDAFKHCRPHVALVSPKLWEASSCTAWQENPPPVIQARPATDTESLLPIPQPEMTRYEAISSLGNLLDHQIIVANLGVPSKELFAVYDRPLNYYMMGSMGLASSIGFGISRFTNKNVIVLEGDGSILMNPNALITIGQYQPCNLTIVVMDNACYGSTGSQRTYTQKKMDLEFLARACGFKNTARVCKAGDLNQKIQEFEQQRELSLIHVIIKPGNSSCPNISLTPAEITKRFKACLENRFSQQAVSF